MLLSRRPEDGGRSRGPHPQATAGEDCLQCAEFDWVYYVIDELDNTMSTLAGEKVVEGEGEISAAKVVINAISQTQTGTHANCISLILSDNGYLKDISGLCVGKAINERMASLGKFALIRAITTTFCIWYLSDRR